ncbi:MAG: serine/threonine-protein kinase [Bacteroidota bacterium]
MFTITEGLENLGAIQTGGQGSVYKARRGDEISAVKILPTPLHSEDPNDKNYRDFQNEVSKLKKVNAEPNPNVVKIISSGITESGSLPFIEMEFIEGPDLENLIRPPHDKVFTISETIKVAQQVSNALAHCHKVSVKHGDIKSNNVKLNNQSGNYVLLDFGLSVMTDEQRRTSLRHAGAIEFMAPEQNDGEMLLQSDVYSFGIILFELLAGTVPFPLNNKSETSRNAVMISHMERATPDINVLRQQNLPLNWEQEKRDFELLVPAWLLAVISKCLEKSPADRFNSGIELHQAIMDSIVEKEVFAYTPVSAGLLAASTDPVPLVPEPADIIPEPLFEDPEPLNLEEEDVPVSPPYREPVEPLPPKTSGNLKPILIALGIIVGLLILFGGYSMLKKPEIAMVDTAAINLENQRLQDSVDSAQRADAERAAAYNASPAVSRSPGNSNGKGKGRGKGKGKKKK